MFNFFEKIWDIYLKKKGKRDYTEEEFNSMFLKELDIFLSYSHLRSSKAGHLMAQEDKEYLVSCYNKIITTVESGYRIPSLRILYTRVKFINKNGFV